MIKCTITLFGIAFGEKFLIHSPPISLLVVPNISIIRVETLKKAALRFLIKMDTVHLYKTGFPNAEPAVLLASH